MDGLVGIYFASANPDRPFRNGQRIIGDDRALGRVIDPSTPWQCEQAPSRLLMENA
jgi:hypothetical protein